MSFPLETRKKFIASLRETPVIEAACKKHGVSRATYYRWLALDANFKRDVNEALAEGRDRYSNIAESVVIKRIHDKDLQASKYWLAHNDDRYRTHPQKEEPPRDEVKEIVEMTRLFCRCKETRMGKNTPEGPCRHERAYYEAIKERQLLRIVGKYMKAVGKHPRDMSDVELRVFGDAILAEYTGDIEGFEKVLKKYREKMHDDMSDEEDKDTPDNSKTSQP